MMKKLIFLSVLLLQAILVTAQLTVTYSDSQSGTDAGPTVATVTFDVLPGTTITDIKISASIGSYCPSWYAYNLNLNGTLYEDLCNMSDQSYSDLNGNAVSGQIITITSVDTDDYGDNITLNLTVTVYYSPPAGAPGLPSNPSPADAATGVALSGNLSWDFGADTETYDLKFGPAGNMNQVITAGVADATGSYAYTDLTGGATAYEWQVIAYNQSKATTTGPVWGFVTDASITDFPYLQDFDNAWTGTPAAPAGWTVINANSDAYLWSQANTYISPTHSGTYAAHGMGNTNDWLISPPIDLTDVNVRISWWDKVESATRPNSYKVYVSTTTNEIASFTVELGDYTCTNTSWEQYFLDLSAYNDQTVYIGFHQYASAATNYGFGIDDFEINEILAQAPETATIGFPYDELTTFNNPLLSWTASATGEPATGFKVYLDETDPPTTEVYDGANTTFQTVDLDPGTTYYWQVVPYNANGDTEGAEVWSFTTASETQLAESFENTTFPPAGWANPGTWSRNTSQAIHGSASAYKWSTATENLLSTPLLNLTETSKIEFFARTASSNTAQRIQVKYSTDRENWTNIGAAAELASNAAFAHFSVDLSSLAGNYYIAFAVYHTGTAGSVYMDHIIGPEPAAVVPDAVTLTAPADAATNQSITPNLSWTAAATGGVPTGYKVFLDENPDPTTLLVTIATSPYTVDPALNYSTTYYWKVVATNATGDGAASAIRSFTTLADPTLTPPFTEAFGTVPPTNWTRLTGLLEDPTTITGTSTGWVADGFANVGSTGAARTNIFGTNRKDWLITPPIDLGDGSVDYLLSFDLALTDYGNSNPITDDPNGTTGVDDKFAVVISTDGGTTWTSANTLMLWDNAGSANVYNDISTTGEEIVIDLAAYSGIVKIGFYGESTVTNADNDLFVDNVTVGANVELDWYNLQWPGTATIKEWGNETIYAQAYKGGVTDPEGQAAGIECWIGYSTEDTDPATWTDWVVATYNGDAGNNDEYKADLGFDQLLEAGTYYYASRFSYLGGPYTYGGFSAGGKGPWNGTTDVNGVLTVEAATIDWANLQFPGTAEITEGGSADVYARIFVENLTATAGESDAIEAWIGVSSENTDPSTWAPAAWTAAAFNAQQGNDDEYKTAIGAGLASGTYYYASRFSLAGNDYVYGGFSEDARAGGFWDGATNVSGVLTVNAYTVNSFPYVEDFEGSVPGWSVYDIDGGGSYWGLSATHNHTSGGTTSAKHGWSSVDTQDGYLVSPEIFIPADGSFVLNFWSYNVYPNDYEKNSVLISTASGNPVDGDFIEVWTTASVTDSWVQSTVDLSTYAGESVFIAFRYEGNNAHDWYVDDVTVFNNILPLTWTGAENNNWHIAANWNPMAAPNASTDVTIPAGLTNYPTLEEAGACNNLTIQSNATSTGSLLGQQWLTVNGDVKIERYLEAGSWQSLSAPLAGDDFNSLYLGGNPDVWGLEYDEAIDDYAYVTSLNTPLGDAKGWLIWIGGAAAQTLEFNGDLRDAITPLSLVNSVPDANHGYNFVGNPYPSAIDWDAAAGWTKTNIDAGIWIWNGTNFSTYVSGSGGTNGGTQHIAMAQGFFVQVNEAQTSGTLNMTTGVQLHDDVAYLKEPASTPADFIRLKLTDGELTDETIIRLDEAATEAYDGQLDMHKLFSFNEEHPQIFSTANDFMTVNVLPPYVISVPVDVRGANGNEMTISLPEVSDFAHVYLSDEATGTTTDLVADSYTFTYDASLTDRFVIYFTIVSNSENILENIRVFSFDKQIRLIIPMDIKTHVEVVNLLGQTVYTTEASMGTTDIKLEHGGYYLVTITGKNNRMSRKVFIK